MSYHRSSYPSSSKRPYEGSSGSSGGGGRQQFPSQPFHNLQRPTEVQVLTNQYKLSPFLSPTDTTSDYCQYDVTIKNGYYAKIKDETTGEESHVFQTRDIRDSDMTKVAKTCIPWRIMKKLVEEYKVEVAYDGDRKAYAPSAALGPEVGKEYKVKVKRDCEEDDPDAQRVRDRWYVVTFHATKPIPYRDSMELLRGGESSSSEEITTMFTVCLKSTAILTRGMISLEPNSSSVFFPLSMQQRLLDRKASLESRDGTKILLSGVEMNVVTVKGGLYVQTESVVKYANKEHLQIFQEEQRHREGASRVPLLNVGNRGATIAGVRIDDVHRPVPEHLRKSVMEAVKKLGNVNVEYLDKKSDKNQLYKNKPLRKSKRDDDARGKGERIIWAANDPSLYTFSGVEGQEMTVATYFEKKYEIKLQFPCMPIIHVDNISKFGGGWFPIEFVYQSFAKSKDNSEEIVTNILKYHDAIAGKKYIDEVGMKLNSLSIAGGDGVTFQNRLAKWRIKIESSAVEATAKVLKPPTIKFGNSVAQVNNGSFNLNRTQFARPAKLASFAVVNFTGNKKSCYDFIRTLLRVAQSHGIDIPSITMEVAQNYLDLVSVHYSGRNEIDEAMNATRDAIQMAKRVHLYDSHHFYRNKNVLYHTHCYSSEQKEFECLVLPSINDPNGPLGLLLDYSSSSDQDQDQERYFSHQVQTNSGNEYKVRLMVKISATDVLIDPLDFRYHNGGHQALRGDGSWVTVQFVEYMYACLGSSMKFREADIRSKTFVHSLDKYEVDFPSIVFAYKPDDGKGLYDRIKMISNYIGGIQSQCAVAKKYESQRNKEQYASNIATKINAKLSTIYEKAISWKSYSDESLGGDDRLPWIGDAPTLVVGIGMVHGMKKTVVAASVCLDGGCMRLSLSCFIQQKSDTISELVMKDIIKVSMDHYTKENGKPERILLFRDGISDGNFNIAHFEIRSVQQALEETIGCTIPITFVICQSQQQGFKMVPSTDTFNGRGKPNTNVGSGTLLQCGPKSFYLISQGGLKGTSKPVKHIVFLNENEEPVQSRCGLSIENLMDLTFQMCWKYPTATKAVRELPPIKYAKRLGNQVLSSITTLEAGCHWFGNNIRLVCPRDESGTEEEQRSYLELNNALGVESKIYNIVQMPFRSHLAA